MLIIIYMGLPPF